MNPCVLELARWLTGIVLQRRMSRAEKWLTRLRETRSYYKPNRIPKAVWQCVSIDDDEAGNLRQQVLFKKTNKCICSVLIANSIKYPDFFTLYGAD
jgi:hypothetical protein